MVTIRKVSDQPVWSDTVLEFDYFYTQFKLFGLAQVWRWHTSSRPYSRDFSIDKAGEDMRLMLLNGDPGPCDRFPFRVVRLWGNDLVDKQFFAPSKGPCKLYRHHATTLLIHGLWWTFITSRKTRQLPDDDCYVGYAPMLRVRTMHWDRGDFAQYVIDHHPTLSRRPTN
jgi:hypothetical protein